MLATTFLCLPYFTVFLQPQIYLDASLQQTEVEPHRPNTVFIDDLADEDDCIQGSKTTNKNNSEQMGNVHSNRRTGVLNSYVQIHIPDRRAICMQYLPLKND